MKLSNLKKKGFFRQIYFLFWSLQEELIRKTSNITIIKLEFIAIIHFQALKLLISLETVAVIKLSVQIA